MSEIVQSFAEIDSASAKLARAAKMAHDLELVLAHFFGRHATNAYDSSNPSVCNKGEDRRR
jgi:hypothetical protein